MPIKVLWQKMLFWKKPQMKYKEGLDFAYINFKDSDITGIQLLGGGYKGVVFHYGKAKIVEEGEMARLQYSYVLVHPGKHDIDVLNEDEVFHTIMGDLLNQILMEKISDEPTRTNDTEKLNIQRTIH